MRKFLILTGLGIVMLLAACSSPEADEVLDYHNDFADNINPKLDKIDALSLDYDNTTSDEEAFEIQKNEIVPVVKEIKEYLDEQDPQEEITKEYHKLRVGWAENYLESVKTHNNVFESSLDGSMTDEEIDEKLEEAQELNMKANELYEKADKRWVEIQEEYDFEEVDE